MAFRCIRARASPLPMSICFDGAADSVYYAIPITVGLNAFRLVGRLFNSIRFHLCARFGSNLTGGANHVCAVFLYLSVAPLDALLGRRLFFFRLSKPLSVRAHLVLFGSSIDNFLVFVKNVPSCRFRNSRFSSRSHSERLAFCFEHFHSPALPALHSSIENWESGASTESMRRAINVTKFYCCIVEKNGFIYIFWY